MNLRTAIRNLTLMSLIAMLLASCSAGNVLTSMATKPELSSLTGLLKNAGGIEKLVGKGPFTLLAPTNDALAKLGPDVLQSLAKPENKEMLTGILKKHIIPGKLDANALKAGGLKTAAGSPLDLGGINLGESIKSGKGMIQMIDGVLK